MPDVLPAVANESYGYQRELNPALLGPSLSPESLSHDYSFHDSTVLQCEKPSC